MDGFNERLDGLDERLAETNHRIDESNTRLDQVVHKLDRTSLSVDGLRAEFNKKLDGIGTYVRSINGHIVEHADKIAQLNDRLNDLEKDKGS
jgi:uncharacterized coiled-coil protein SlyX